MTKNNKQKLTLDRPATYQIIVPGQLDQRWSDWYKGVTVTVDRDDDGLPVSILTVAVDQAALQGMLRRLYSLGSPLICVICIECGSGE